MKVKSEVIMYSWLFLASISLSLVHFLGTPASRTRIREATGEIQENRTTIHQTDSEMHALMREHIQKYHFTPTQDEQTTTQPTGEKK